MGAFIVGNTNTTTMRIFPNEVIPRLAFGSVGFITKDTSTLVGTLTIKGNHPIRTLAHRRQGAAKLIFANALPFSFAFSFNLRYRICRFSIESTCGFAGFPAVMIFRTTNAITNNITNFFGAASRGGIAGS